MATSQRFLPHPQLVKSPECVLRRFTDLLPSIAPYITRPHLPYADVRLCPVRAGLRVFMSSVSQQYPLPRHHIFRLRVSYIASIFPTLKRAILCRFYSNSDRMFHLVCLSTLKRVTYVQKQNPEDCDGQPYTLFVPFI